MASGETSLDASASLDRWSELDFPSLLAEARATFAAGNLAAAHDLAYLGLTQYSDSAQLLTVLGWVYAEQSDFAQAESAFRHSLSRDGASVDALAGLAAVLAARGDFAEAVPHYQQSLALRADDPQTLFNFGSTLLSLGRSDEAIERFEQSLELQPRNEQAIHNLAIAHAQLGDWRGAKALCDRTLSIRPDAWHTQVLRGMSRIALGSFADGWDDYEARHRGRGDDTRCFGLPEWRGPGDDKRSIAVIPEQGVGTQVLFASCVGKLAAHVPNVTVGCEPRLIGPLRRSLTGAHVVAGNLLPLIAKAELVDCYIMAGSLPCLFRRSADAFAGSRYLVAEPHGRAHWRQRLAALGPGLKVGVSWGGGGRRTDASHRHTEPAEWRGLASIEGTHWINLQYDTLPAELEAWQRQSSGRFHDFAEFDKKFDLENLFALVSELDLVISVVNSNVHFAGALGTPTWALIPRGGEWRWQDAGEKCVWHDSVRLLRQERLGNWSGVFAQLEPALRAFAHVHATADPRSRAA